VTDPAADREAMGARHTSTLNGLIPRRNTNATFDRALGLTPQCQPPFKRRKPQVDVPRGLAKSNVDVGASSADDDNMPLLALKAPRQVPPERRWLAESSEVHFLNSPASPDKQLDEARCQVEVAKTMDMPVPRELQWQLWEQAPGLTPWQPPPWFYDEGLPVEETTELLWSSSHFTAAIQRWLRSVRVPDELCG